MLPVGQLRNLEAAHDISRSGTLTFLGYVREISAADIWNITVYSDSLRAGRSGDRIPVKARFSALVQIGPWAYRFSNRMGTGTFPGVKQPGRGFDHPTPFSAEVKEKVGLYLYSPYGPSMPILGWTLPLLLFEGYVSSNLLETAMFVSRKIAWKDWEL